MDTTAVIKTESLNKTYTSGEIKVEAVKDININIDKGEFAAIIGPSGSGKTTLLNLIGGLDNPSAGSVSLGGKKISSMDGNELSDYRRDHIGFIFQSYNLIPVLTVKENIEYIMMIQGIPTGERHKRVMEILKNIGLEGMENRIPSRLSGGQQQRVAVARAVIAEPDIVLADEPTANLDSGTGSALLDMMRELNEKLGITFLFSTHDNMIMERAKRLIVLKDGQVLEDNSKS